MASMISSLFAAAGGEPSAEEKIEIGDIEAQLRTLTSSAQRAISEGKTNAIVGGLLGVGAMIALSYLHGRRRGRRRASVLEIRRI